MASAQSEGEVELAADVVTPALQAVHAALRVLAVANVPLGHGLAAFLSK